MPSLIPSPSQPVATGEKPLAEVVVEGELSPFEHEALYRLLRKSFKVEQPSYRELSDEDLATRVNVVFHHPYSPMFCRRTGGTSRSYSNRSPIAGGERGPPSL